MERKSVDTPLSLLVIAMLIFGMVMISSVSVFSSHELTTELVAKGKFDKVTNAYFLNQTIKNVFIGIIMLTIFSKIPYRIYEKYAKFGYFLGLF